MTRAQNIRIKVWKKILNGKFNLRMDTIRAFFSKIRTLFSIFKKVQGRPPPPYPLLVARLYSSGFTKIILVSKIHAFLYKQRLFSTEPKCCLTFS